jgi:hypothetical protein|tara:strand:- start:619 stop:1065 length:447 start_codon:yes stop_codon:yes gene_type:complete
MNTRRMRGVLKDTNLIEVVDVCKGDRNSFPCAGLVLKYGKTRPEVPVWVYMEVWKDTVPEITWMQVENAKLVHDQYHKFCKTILNIDYQPSIILGTDAHMGRDIMKELYGVGNIMHGENAREIRDIVSYLEYNYFNTSEKAWMKTLRK